MATSTFGKNFTVRRRESASFVKEMCRAVPPTLSPQFKSNYTTLAQNEELKAQLLTILGK